MRRLRPQFRLWVLLLVVAAVAIVLGVHQRWARFRKLAQYHEEHALQCRLMSQSTELHVRGTPDEEAERQRTDDARRRQLSAKSADHERMARYYESRW